MAAPRVFVSSTYYDLRHIRASLEGFLRSLGYEAVLSEKGHIAYSHDRPLDESCYAEVSNCDVLVAVVGGRSGSAASAEGRTDVPKSFYERYESITRKEVERAVADDTPIYVLVDRGVMSEFQTYRMNRGNSKINYAHVDSINVFELLEHLTALSRNNAMFAFDNFAEAENWLRQQFAGLLGDLLRRRTQQQQIGALAAQVGELRDVSDTLRTYLESVMSKVAPTESAGLIEQESERLRSNRLYQRAMDTRLIRYLLQDNPVDPSVPESSVGRRLVDIMVDSESLSSCFVRLAAAYTAIERRDDFIALASGVTDMMIDDINEVRSLFEVPALSLDAEGLTDLHRLLLSIRAVPLDPEAAG